MNATPLNPRLPRFVDVKPRCRGHWAEILHPFLGDSIHPALERRPRHAPCPRYGGKDGFHLYRDFDETGGGYSNGELRGFADGFDLLAWALGISTLDALNRVAAHLGVVDRDRRIRTERHDVREPSPITNSASHSDAADRHRTLHRLWAEAKPLDHPEARVARRYLRRRGLHAGDDDLPTCLRLHPRLPYWMPAGDARELRKLGDFPALLAQVRAPDGSLVTLQRTYLTAEGTKAPVPAPRKLMPAARSLHSAAIQLDRCASILHVTEGLETALAVREVVGPSVWALLSAVSMPRFDVPEGVEQLVIWADRDRPNRLGYRTGEHAANLLVEQARLAGCAVTVFVPPYSIPHGQKSLDWLDVLNAHGFAGFPIVRLRPPHRTRIAAPALPIRDSDETRG